MKIWINMMPFYACNDRKYENNDLKKKKLNSKDWQCLQTKQVNQTQTNSMITTVDL